MDQAHSRWEIEDRQTHTKISPAYYGFVWIDEKDNSVVEFYMKAKDLPSTFSITEAESRLYYDTAEISGIPFMLPSRGEMHLLAGKDDQKNLITFHNYQKYSADATVKFDDIAPDPLEKKQRRLAGGGLGRLDCALPLAAGIVSRRGSQSKMAAGRRPRSGTIEHVNPWPD